MCLVNSGNGSVFMKFLFFICLFLFDWTWNFVTIIPLVLGYGASEFQALGYSYKKYLVSDKISDTARVYGSKPDLEGR